MKFVLSINLKLPTIVNSFLLNLVEHENFSANRYENVNYCCRFHISKENVVFSPVKRDKSFITSRPGLEISYFASCYGGLGTLIFVFAIITRETSFVTSC